MRMSLAAKGAYRGLIDKGWELGGRIPNDPEIMWRYAGALSAEEFAAVADQVLSCFTVSEDGKWLTNETLTEEWEATDDYFEDLGKKRSEAGKKGNEKRWGRKVSQPVTTPSQSIAQHNTVTTQHKEPNPPTPLPVSDELSPDDREDAVMEIWNLCPRKIGEPRSKRAITEALIHESQTLGQAGAVAYLKAQVLKWKRVVEPYKHDQGLMAKVNAPWTWFADKRYNDEPASWIPVGALDGKPIGSKEQERRTSALEVLESRRARRAAAGQDGRAGVRQADKAGTIDAGPVPDGMVEDRARGRDAGAGAGISILHARPRAEVLPQRERSQSGAERIESAAIPQSLPGDENGAGLQAVQRHRVGTGADLDEAGGEALPVQNKPLT